MSRTKNQGGRREREGKKLSARPSTESTSVLSGKRRIAVLALVLAAATIAVYSPVFGSPFVIMDDQEYVTANPHVQDGLSWGTVRWAFTSTETAAYWHPLTWLSHALDCQLFGLDPAGHHFDSVLLHALNAALLFVLLVWLTERIGASLLVAALFAVHPLNVESVAWVAERKNVLSTLFFLLAIAAYAWYVRKPHWQRYLPVAGMFTAGLMAKPSVVTLPCVLLLLDYWPLNRIPHGGEKVGQVSTSGIPRVSWTQLILEKVPLLLLSAASSWITVIAQGRVELTMAELSLRARIENALVSYGLYLWKMLWPARLAAFYPYPKTTPVWELLSAVFVLVMGTTVVTIFRRKAYLPVGWCWFVGTLVPAIGLVQVWKQGMADRFAYIPLIGIFIMIAWGFDDWAETRKLRNVWRVFPPSCVLLALATVSVRQMGYWGSQYDLWSRSLAVEESMDGHNAIGEALIASATGMSQRDLEIFDTEQKRVDEERRHFQRVVEMCRQENQLDRASMASMVEALNNLAFVDRTQGLPDELQREHYEEALQVERELQSQDSVGRYRKLLVTTLISLGNLDVVGKRMEAARQHYEEALRIDRQLIEQHLRPYLPYMAMALVNLAQVNRDQERLDDAQQNYEDATNVFRHLAEQEPNAYLPKLAQVLNARAAVDKKQNRLQEARAHYSEALTIYRQLALQNPGYSNDFARVETRLRELESTTPSR